MNRNNNLKNNFFFGKEKCFLYISFGIQGYRTVQKAHCALKVLVAMNELLQVSHSIALSQLCDVGISMLGGG